MIYYRIPWDTDKNLGRAYNREMELLPNDDDYACFIDRDAMFTTIYYGKQIEEIINQTNFDLYVARTNRVNNKKQVYDKKHWWNDDMKFHYKLGEQIATEEYGFLEDITNSEGMSGVCFILRKSAWKRIGGIKEARMLGIDNQIHYGIRDTGGKVMLMRGVYVYHWYRGGEFNKVEHLKQ